MTAYINKIKDKDGNQQLPVTHERAVRDDNGTTLESKMQNLEGAMDKAYVASSDNGMGRITLKKNLVDGVNTLTQAMMQATNTIYVIRYDYTLASDITVPANCVMKFEGGSISGSYTITFTDTKLEGTYRGIKVTSITGTIKGTVNCGHFNLCYGENVDNGAVINSIASICKYLYIPAGDLYFSTPIIMENMKLVTSDANLIYNGSATDVSAITIEKANSAKIFFNRILGNTNIVFASTNNSKRVGLNFNSCNGCNLSFNIINYFNEGLRVSDTYNVGCCYNTIQLGTIEMSNYHIRLYQKDYNGQISWVNQNLFIGGRLYNYSTWDSTWPCYKVFMYGAKFEGDTDTFDRIDTIQFIGTSLEGIQTGFYIRNGRFIQIIGTRHESYKALKLIDCEENIHFDPGLNRYGPNSYTDIDLTENGLSGLSENSFQFRYQIPLTSYTDFQEIDVSTNKALRIVGTIYQSYSIRYLEDEDGPISEDDQENYIAPYYTSYVSSAKSFSMRGTILESRIYLFPDSIKKIGIKLWHDFGSGNFYANMYKLLYT